MTSDSVFESGAFADLRTAYEAGELIVFAGAGVSASAGLPTWRRLAEQLLQRVDRLETQRIEEVESYLGSGKLIDAMSALEAALGANEFSLAVEGALNDGTKEIPDVVRAIAELRPKLRAVVTTNLDRFIERAFNGEWDELTDPPADLAQRRHYILKLHGTRSVRASWVFARREYDRAMFGSPKARSVFASIHGARKLLFIGCGLSDDDLDATLASTRALSGSQPPTHFALVAKPLPPSKTELLRAAGIRFLAYDNADGTHRRAAAILRALGAAGQVDTPERPRSLAAAPTAAARTASHDRPRSMGVAAKPAPTAPGEDVSDRETSQQPHAASAVASIVRPFLPRGTLLLALVALLLWGGARLAQSGDDDVPLDMANDGTDARRPILPPDDLAFIDARSGAGWGDRCWEHLRAGRWGWAKAECDRGLKMDPPTPQTRAALLFNEGLIARAANDFESARQRFLESLELQENAEVRTALGSVNRR